MADKSAEVAERAGHTPGPWRAEKPDMFGDCNILHDGDALAVAAVVSNMRTEGEVLANARLIAAAPELLASAKAILAHLEARIDGAPSNAVPVFAGIVELHDAIAKAEGRT